MVAPARRQDGADDTKTRIDAPPLESVVTSHETRPGKVVLTERDNTDGWIACDVAVDLEP